MVKGRN